MAITRDEVEEEICAGEKRKQESIGKGSNEQEFETSLPSSQSGRFKSHFGLGETQRHFNLPASGIGKNNLPSLLGIVNRFGRDQVPGFAPE